MAATTPTNGLRVPLTKAEAQALPLHVAVTGASSYLSSALIKRLLVAGHFVHGTARDPADTAKLGHLQLLPGAAERLQLFKADLLVRGSFDQAFAGCKYVIHVATPVTNKVPKGKGLELVVGPAVHGVENVLSSVHKAGTVEAVVMTSSIIAVMGGKNMEDPQHVFTEADWNELAEDVYFPYAMAKVESEKRAWELVKEYGAQRWRLVTVIPGLITGPPDIMFESDILKGYAKVLGGKLGSWTFPIGIPSVDVDDCAMVHVLAMLSPTAAGRYLCSAGSPTMLQCFSEAQRLYPDVMAKCSPPTKAVPKWLARLVAKVLGLFPDMVSLMYGRQLVVDTSRITQELGAVLMPPSRSWADMAQRMLDLGAIKPRRTSCCG